MLTRKVFLMLVLGLTSGSAMAEWTLITKGSAFALYLELDAIRKDGDKLQVWDMFDLKEAKITGDGHQYLSKRTLLEFDCKQEQARTLSAIGFSENMGNGEEVASSDQATPWQPLDPLILRSIYTITCGKR